MSNISVKKTHDGSATLYNASLNEHYHSIHGALTESLHVFIQNGLIPAIQQGHQKINILEIGLGTGLNAALTAAECEAKQQAVEYTGLEPFPVESALLYELGYDELLDVQQSRNFHAIHAAQWHVPERINPYFLINKRQVGLLHFQADEKFHLIYFDAFAPEKQPDLWTLDILQKCFGLLEKKGILITYCAQGQFKRNLKQCGFIVEAKPGPPFKREITFAVKP